MKRRAWVIGMTALAVMFAGTLVYAAVTVIAPEPATGTIHACYDKGGKGAGKIRIVSAGTECKRTENALQWRAMSSLNELDLTTCKIGDTNGTTTLEWDPDGYARFKCEGATPPECTSGATRGCYSGPPGTDGIGECSAGTQTCTGGTWGACQGEVGPAPEVCDALDNDCDGAVDDDCSADVDECALGTHTCDGNAECSNTVGSFDCTCNEGYAGDGDTTGTGCTDVDECSLQTDVCVTDATCTNMPGSYSCACNAGLVGDGREDGSGCTPAP